MRVIDAIGLKQALAVSAILDDNKTIEQIIDEQPTIEPEQQWIPCSERLPEIPNMYTVTDSKGDVVRFVFTDTESSRKYWLRCAKAWLPLPEPWRGEEHES